MRLLRILSVLAAGLFAYLALIPGGLVVATVDPACSGAECGYSVVGDVALVLIYAAAFLALLASAASFVRLALDPDSARASQRVVRVLGATAVCVGLAMFAIFAIGSPIAALVIAVIGVVCFSVLWRRRHGPRGPHDPTEGNGIPHHAQTNGHGPKLDRLPKV